MLLVKARVAGRSVEIRLWRAAAPDPHLRRATPTADQLRYRGLSAAAKKSLVDGLVAITGYHRSSVLRVLNRRPICADVDSISAEPHLHHRCRCGPMLIEAPVLLRQSSDRFCDKRSQALLSILLVSLELQGRLAPRSGGEAEASHDQQRQDRSAAGSRAKDKPGQWLASTTEGTQRGAAAQAGAHV